MKPATFFAELGKLLTLSLAHGTKIYREEPMTAEELDTFTDRVLLLAKELKDGK